MDANIAYYCLHKFHKWPHEYLKLDINEQAFVVAAIDLYVEEEKRQARKMNSK